MEKAKATIMCLIEEEIKDFFESYEDREDAMRAWENVSHTLVAYMLLMHQDKNDFIKLLDDFYGDEEEEEVKDQQCLNCNEVMSYDRWEAGKMCCDKPRFEGDESDEESDDFTCDHCGEGGNAEELTEGIEDCNNIYLHDDCVDEWEVKHSRIFERRDESAEEAA